MKILVTGGRNYGQAMREQDFIYDVLDEICPNHVIEGGASGADAVARAWCEHREVQNTTYKADWDRLGKWAGPRRNTLMLTHGKPDLVVAFQGGRGTANMVSQANGAGVPIRTERQR